MNHLKLKGILAERQMPQWRLATTLHIPPSTFSEYLRGAREAPPDLMQRIERELHLKRGELRIQ